MKRMSFLHIRFSKRNNLPMSFLNKRGFPKEIVGQEERINILYEKVFLNEIVFHIKWMSFLYENFFHLKQFDL